MRALLMIVIASFVAPDRPDPTPPKKVEKARPLQEQLQGEWQLTKAVRRGMPEDAVKVTGTLFIIKGNLIQILEGGKDRSEDANFTLDAGKTPAHLDITPTRGGKGREIVIQGILKIEGDLLTICFPHGGRGSRPTAFASPPDMEVSLLELRRVKK